jgi:hypothetical protein
LGALGTRVMGTDPIEKVDTIPQHIGSDLLAGKR